MKKTMMLMAGALIASVVVASAQEVLSANAVGYIKKTLPAGGKLVMMSIPLDSMTETDIVFGRTSVAQEAPQNSTVYFWNPATQKWELGVKGIKGWQAAQSNRIVASGEAFFLKGVSSSVEDFDVTITGEVPAETPRVVAMPGGNALGTVANSYPVDFKFGESDVAKNATQNSTVYFWNESTQKWELGVKGIKGWQAAQSNRVVLAGEGFFLKEIGTVTTWTNAKPYTWT